MRNYTKMTVGHRSDSNEKLTNAYSSINWAFGDFVCDHNRGEAFVVDNIKTELNFVSANASPLQQSIEIPIH